MGFTENRNLMAILAAVFLLFAVAIYSYKTTLSQIAEEACSSQEPCSHERIVWAQDTVIAVLLIAMAAMAAGYFMLARKNTGEGGLAEKQSGRRKVDISMLEPDERKVVAILQAGGGPVFQGEIKNKLGYSKVKVSRILDRMEHRGFVEKRKRGMANLVVLK